VPLCPPQILLGLTAIEWYEREKQRQRKREREREKILENMDRELFQCHFVHHKSYLDCAAIEACLRGKRLLTNASTKPLPIFFEFKGSGLLFLPVAE